MSELKEYKVPKALFNSKALFNPYQYKPFRLIMKWENGNYIPNGKNILITDEVGVGKTFEVGIILRELLCANPNLSVLIICPVKLCENWESELVENFGIGAVNYHSKRVMGQVSIVPYSYFTSRKSGQLKDEIEETETEKILAAEEAEEGKKAEITDKIKQMNPFEVLILDEAHYIRNKGALWGYIFQLIEKQEKNKWSIKIFMTGTPVFNSEDDYVHITELLSDHGQTFETTTTLQGEANCYDEILSIKFGGMKENQPGEVIDASEAEKAVYKEISLSKYGKHTGFLKRISSSSYHSLKQYVEKDSAFHKSDMEMEDCIGMEETEQDFSKLRELLRGWSPNKDSKLSALKDLLDYLKNKEQPKEKFKAVIFSCFITTCNYLKEQLGSHASGYHTYIITGKTSVKKMSEYKAAFADDEEPSVLICSDVLKEGHNLQFCHYLIHYDFPYTPAAIGQRNGRIYRKGQKDKPEVYYLPVKDGYDTRLFGEIIVEKCQINKELEKQGKVSALNILPTDAKDYIKTCVKVYIDDFFDTESVKSKKKESEKAEYGNDGDDRENSAKDKSEKEIAGKFLERYFTEKNRDSGNIVQLDWKSDQAKELFDKIQEKPEDCRKMLTEFYQDMLEKSDTGQSIQAIYMKEYHKLLAGFVREWFGCEEPDEQRAKEEFISCCESFVKLKDKSAVSKTKYCHDLMRDTGISIDEYKEQFQPLKEWT